MSTMRRYVVTRAERFPEDRMTVLVDATGREMAKKLARPELGGNSDKYIVEPLPPINIDRARIIWKDSGEVRT